MTPSNARHLAVVACALLAAVAVPGCADPYADTRQPAPPTTPARTAPPAGELAPQQPDQRVRGDERAPARSPSAPPATPARRSGDPATAVRDFCVQFVNWNWASSERQQRRLAALSAGALRRQYLASAQTAKFDQRLADDRMAMRGRLVAVQIDGHGPRRRGLCLARQEQLQNGRGELAGAQHAVYLAHLARLDGRWAITEWQPQL
jgi:hypothetical protein